ncbi:hypothetical protein J6590_106678 [Homalodisca vitripennis]|nr:hypothetical protein J6590_106678 [Homalodisca vitripennis]
MEKHSSTIYCQNSFEVLSEDNSEEEEEFSNTPDTINSLSKRTKNVSNTRKVNILKKISAHTHVSLAAKSKLLIMADSHGTNLSNLVQQKTNLNVTAVVRPGAKINGVIKEVEELSSGFNEDDFILVIGGTNNVESTGKKHILEEFGRLMECTKKTNLIVATLPMRHDKPELDSKIDTTNTELTTKISNMDTNIRLLELHLLPRHLYTNHGMHYNKRGKRKIAEEVLRTLQYSRSTLTATTTPQVVSESRPSHSPPNTDYPAGIGLVTPSTAPRIPAIICSPNLDSDKSFLENVETSMKEI